MKLFVPGRICLFGEHSDWAGGYRRINSELERGYAIIAGTTQGIYAEAKPHPSKLVLETTLSDGTRKKPFEIEMKREALLAEAQAGGFFSYACGVAYQISIHYHVNGLQIDNYETDLPTKKGLSSSAATCVLIARAFNRVYDLKMTARGEMEYAYQGEITTPSRCGRMDQGCAFGNNPIGMTFDGDRIDVEELRAAKDLFCVIVDLETEKDTREILAKLNSCYPFATDAKQKQVQAYLGAKNREIVNNALAALQRGDAQELGRLMNLAQECIDSYLQPACPSQLTAPVLHRVLGYEPIQDYIYGGKGVGSLGDGSAQFIAKDEECQKKVIQIIEKDLSMSCLPLVLRSARGIRKAVIPAAGFGTRLFPASKAVKKELFPIVDADGLIKPAILVIIEEAVNSGIQEVALIVQKRDAKIFEDLLFAPPEIENLNRLSQESQAYSNHLLELGRRVTLLTQDVQEGFGHAVFCAREWVGEEPFLLMLGDHLYSAGGDVSCTRQMLDVYAISGSNVVGLKEIGRDDLERFGCVAGIWEEKGSLLNLTELHEKPSPEYAEDHLQIDGLKTDRYLAFFGQYVMSPDIFNILEDHISHNIREGGEFQLTSCLDELRKQGGFAGYVVRGQSYDIGVPEMYRRTLLEYNRDDSGG